MNRNSVLIVGAGPVGLVNALGLAQAGVHVTVLEKEPAVVDEPRAMVYHWAAHDGLERMGLLDDLTKAGFTTSNWSSFRLFTTGETISFHYDGVLGDEVRHPFNLHLGQDRLAEVVLAHLARFPNVSVVWNATVTELSQDSDGVTVSADTPDGPREFRAGWVIGTDGARSTVRQLLGLNFDGLTWPERFVATNVRFDFDRYGYTPSTMQIDPVYGAVVSKIDDTGLWRCTYFEDAALPEEQVRERIPSYFDAVLPAGEEYELVQYSSYRMHQRAAERFRVGRVLLAGDAAHATNPTSGFGLLTGLFDSFVLFEALAAVIHGQIGDEVLDRYAEDRRRVFLDYTSPISTRSKKFLFHSDDPVQLEKDLAELRKTAGDKALQRERFMTGKKIESPSLLTGQASR
ncbi:NAD(P)/FAD-dependent oxidoreductase [Streptomyces sp. GbtcB7]|uniref:FAD-dependent oxidoreductase n=1 Tax=Streptomyces sp. GbtcB7 TaxID=2824752 RepID=UPI0020C67081|nr:FAD-dependent monooxygenase [Streptomyces sp. GbtcB7]